jgi:hypothetical protein
MYLRWNRRRKDGKEHRYWSIVESKRCAGGKVVQRQVLYLGEINDSQRAAWCHLIEAFDEEAQRHRQLALFPADHRHASPHREICLNCEPPLRCSGDFASAFLDSIDVFS